MLQQSDYELISDYDNFLKTVVFGNVFTNSNNGKTVTIRTSNKKIPMLKLTSMYCPFGLSKYNEKYSLDMSLEDGELLNFLKRFESLVKSKPVESDEWFGSIKSESMIDSLNIPLVKMPKNDKYSPTLKGTVLLFDQNKVESTKLFNCNREQISISEKSLPKGVKCSCVMSLSSIWIIGSRFGVTVRFNQLKVDGGESTAKEVGSNLPDYAFVEDSDDDT